MSSQIIKITPLGSSNPESKGEEVLLVGVSDASGFGLEASSELAPEGWDLMTDVAAGDEFGVLDYAYRAHSGSLELECGLRGRLAFITHPWSGKVQIEAGEDSVEIDLYSGTTSVLFIDLPGGQQSPATPSVLRRMAMRAPAADGKSGGAAAPEAGAGNPAGQTEGGELVITALGEHATKARAAEVVVLHLEPFGLGIASDLAVYQGKNWERAGSISLDGVYWEGGLKSSQGTLRMDCSSAGSITFLRHEWSGMVEISHGGITAKIDLYSPRPAALKLKLSELGLLVASHGETVEGSVASAPVGSSLNDTPRRELYQRLTQGFDTDQPVGLYVPRWHGVAASTKALFSQTLPIPETLAHHPDDITEEDIIEYADVLVDSGCRHFVVSGGDLFNLKIIERVQARAPETRFDQLWHSNFLQMGEPHDWNLLRHWLVALRDGTVTRIGVVKEGLAEWFGQFGMDAVFIPNVIEFDTAAVKPTTVSDTVGIWLSGSSSYRKLPHAALMALKGLPQVSLMGAGLDDHSMQMINDLKLPFRQLSSKPLPQSQMFKRMQTTGLTLYVTVSECSPMVPLESFALGVPCLVGPSSHMFRSHDLLREALVVKHPHSPFEIAEKITWALAHQAELFEAYLSYYEDEKRMAKEGVLQLVS